MGSKQKEVNTKPHSATAHTTDQPAPVEDGLTLLSGAAKALRAPHQLRENRKKLSSLVLSGFVTTVLVTACATATEEAAPTTALTEPSAVTTPPEPVSNVPHYYHEFVREDVLDQMIVPCEEFPISFFEGLELDAHLKIPDMTPTNLVHMCLFEIHQNVSEHIPKSTAYIFGGDPITPEVLKANLPILGEDDGWLYTDEVNFNSPNTCTASVPTKRGRFSVTYVAKLSRPPEQLSQCRMAKRMAIAAGDYLFGAQPTQD